MEEVRAAIAKYSADPTEITVESFNRILQPERCRKPEEHKSKSIASCVFDAIAKRRRNLKNVGDSFDFGSSDTQILKALVVIPFVDGHFLRRIVSDTAF